MREMPIDEQRARFENALRHIEAARLELERLQIDDPQRLDLQVRTHLVTAHAKMQLLLQAQLRQAAKAAAG
jgi:hypothetical protein